MQLNNNVRNAMLDAIDTLINAGGSPEVRLYEGDPDVAGASRAQLPLNTTAFEAAATGAMALDVSPAVQDTGPSATTGTGIDYAGFYLTGAASAGAWVLKLGVLAAGGDLTMANNTLATTDTVQITSFSITMPAGSPVTT